ncbi:MAG TPA: hypothetical protein VJN92_08580, partial [Candidatus Acidoferrum sp.]|nr:hypothetical protein [Candidatus Acidoferrum sp.]
MAAAASTQVDVTGSAVLAGRPSPWQRALELVRQWEAEGQQIEKPKPLTAKEACDKFLADAEDRLIEALNAIPESTYFFWTGL